MQWDLSAAKSAKSRQGQRPETRKYLDAVDPDNLDFGDPIKDKMVSRRCGTACGGGPPAGGAAKDALRPQRA
jgi:hypothetical protein